MVTNSAVGPGPRRVAVAALAVAFAIICLYPHLSRLRNPSLFSDDVMRIADLQVGSLRSTLFRPFNEHMAPFFEAVSWVAWQLAGRDLEAASLAYTLASYAPYVLCLAVLGLVVRRELGSTATALVAVALFSLSSVYAEAIYWYSASSFTWALAWTLAALLAAGMATGGRRRAGSLAAAALAAMLAPSCSAIGLLAGPLGTLRMVSTRVGADRPRARAAAMIPMAGTLAYLGLCRAFRYQEVLAESLERNIDLTIGLASIARAPIDVLMPGLFGLGNMDHLLGGGADLLLAGVALVGTLGWARSSRHRPLILCGLMMMIGGYALTYCVRTVHGPHWILMVQRYHLFPQLGLVLVLAPALRPALARFDARAGLALRAATLVALGLLLVHRADLKSEAKLYRFPDQGATLSAMERLGRPLPGSGDHPIAGADGTGPDPASLVPPRLQRPADARPRGGDRSGAGCDGPADPAGGGSRPGSVRHSAAGWTPRRT